MRQRIMYGVLAYTCLLLYAINFKWLSDYLFLGIIVFGFLDMNREDILLSDKAGLCIIWTFITYFSIMFLNGELNNIKHDMMVFLIMPIFGYHLSNRIRVGNRLDCLKELYYVILGIVFMNSIYGALNYYMRLQHSSVLGWVFRYSYDIWTGQLVAPTNQGANFTLVVSLMFWAIITFKKNRLLSTGIVLLSIVGLTCGFDTASRTILIIFVLMLLINIVIYAKQVNINKKLLITFIVVVLALLLYLAYMSDFAGIRTSLFESNLTQRMDQLEYEGYEEGRFQRWSIVLKQAPRYLMGNMPPKEWHAHNLWLDIYKDAGVLPFVGIALYTIVVLRDIRLVIHAKCFDIPTKLMMVSVVTGLMVNFTVEPVLNAIPMIFCEFIIITGYIHKYLKRFSAKGDSLYYEDHTDI